jgi:hypothetical protein
MNMQDVFENWIVLGGRDNHEKLFPVTMFVEFRNKMGRTKIPKSSNEVFHETFQFLQRSRILLND